MLKNLLIIFSLFMICNSCCDDSKGCCGKPSNPQITELAKAWLKPFESKEQFIFENQLNQLDTLDNIFTRDKIAGGGDECIELFNHEQAFLVSKADTAIKFKIEAIQNSISINSDQNDPENKALKFITIYSFLGNKNLTVNPDFAEKEFLSDYPYKGERLSAIKAECRDVNRCKSLKMPYYLVSKEKGLLEFRDNKGNTWSLIK